MLVVAIVALAALAALFARSLASDARQKASWVTMKADLSGLSQRETQHRAAHGRFTTAIDSAGFRWSNGVQLVDLRATTDSWSATIRHAGAPGVCSIEVSASNPGSPECH